MKDEKFYLRLINYIKTSGKLPINGTKQRLSYHLKKLKKEGVLVKLGYATYSIDEEKKKLFLDKISKKEVKKTPKVRGDNVKNFTSENKKIRGHGFVFVLDLEKTPKIPRWEDRKRFMDSRNISYKQLWQNRDGEKIIYKEHKIWLTNKRIIIYTPKGLSYFGESAEDTQKYAIYDVHQILKHIEYLFKISLSKNGVYQVDISRQHYAKTDDPLAKKYNKNKDKLEVKKDGKTWLLIDNSFGLDELETVDNKTSNKDMDKKIVPYFNDIRDHENLLPSEVTKNIYILQKQLQEMAQGQVNNQYQLNSTVKMLNMLLGKENEAELSPEDKSIPSYIG